MKNPNSTNLKQLRSSADRIFFLSQQLSRLKDIAWEQLFVSASPRHFLLQPNGVVQIKGVNCSIHLNAVPDE
ncbi:MAG: hypothetical protein KKF98_15060 [Bacteroidetes bacterium]|nr:hypothetical protein [Bacteroidota bacterium]